MKLKYRIILMAGICGAIAALLILLPGDRLDKYRDLFERGHLAASREALAQELVSNPSWHPGRLLLIRVELADNRVQQALHHLAALIEAGQIDEPARQLLESEFPSVAGDIDPAGCLDILLPVLEQSDWGWLRMYALALAVEGSLPEAVPKVLETFTAADFNQFNVGQAWEVVMQSEDPFLLWQTATLIDSRGHSNQAAPQLVYRQWVVQILTSISDLLALQREHPHCPVLAIYRTAPLEPGEALAWLREWEGENQVPQAYQAWYSQQKAAVLALTEQPEARDLALVQPQDLVQVAVNSVCPQTQALIAEYLADLGVRREMVKLAELAAAAPRPLLRLERPVFFAQVSPEGRWLLLENGPVVLVSLVDGQQTTIYGVGSWRWSPDGCCLAFLSSWSGNQLEIIDTAGETVVRLELGEGEYHLHGWLDNCRLLLTAFSSQDVTEDFVFNPFSGWREYPQWLGMAPDSEEPWHLGRGGLVARQKGRHVYVWDGENVREFPLHLSDADLAGWIPDGSGLLVHRGRNDIYHLRLDGTLMPLGAAGRLSHWVDETTFCFIEPLDDTYSALSLYNLNTRQVSATGIVFDGLVAGGGNRVAVRRAPPPGARSAVWLDIYRIP